MQAAMRIVYTLILTLLLSCNLFDSNSSTHEDSTSSNEARSSAIAVITTYINLVIPDTVLVKEEVRFRGRTSTDITTVEFFIDNYSIGSVVTTDGRFSHTYAIQNSGDMRIVDVIGYNQNTKVFHHTDTITVVAGEPPLLPDSHCLDQLDSNQVSYTASSPIDGIETPILLDIPLYTMSFRYVEHELPRSTLLMDCTLALALAKAIPLLQNLDIVEIIDFGVYSYRCIGGGAPPNCSSGISEHARATALDIAGFMLSDSTIILLENDWVTNRSSETCAQPGETPSDSLLHMSVCQMHADSIWGNSLTPNYNDDHSNHFHLDLKEGDYFLKKLSTDIFGVDLGFDWH